MNSTRYNAVIPFPLRALVALLTMAAWWAGSLTNAEAGSRPSLQLVAPAQVVIIGSTAGIFEADVLVSAEGHACGNVRFALRDGTVIELQPIYGIIHEDRLEADSQTQTVEYNNVGVSLVLSPRIGPLNHPGDLVIATVSPSGEVGCDIWDFIGTSMSGGTSGVPFDAQTRHLRSDNRCEPADLGQFDISIAIDAPRQTVTPFSGSDQLDFSANVFVGQDNAAYGVVYAPFSDKGGLYQIFFGMVLPHEKLGFQIFLVGRRPNTQGSPSNDDFLRAVMHPLDLDIDPECQIWDLINGESGGVPHAATFEAETHLRIPPSSRR